MFTIECLKNHNIITMDSSDSDIPDVSTTLDIQPYQFEPLVNEENHDEEQNSTSESSDIDDISQTVDRLVNTDW